MDDATALRAELHRLRRAATAVLFFRHAGGQFVDGWRAQEVLNELNALIPPGFPRWPHPDPNEESPCPTPTS